MERRWHMTVEVVTNVMKAGAALCVGASILIIAIKADKETANRALLQCGGTLKDLAIAVSNR